MKSSLLRTLARCQEPQCVQLQEKYKIGQLDTEIQYNKVTSRPHFLLTILSILEIDQSCLFVPRIHG